jgi:oligoribonuclease NrnB/cAMP/cGMP phosphodiesterase (DHH superfamily)
MKCFYHNDLDGRCAGSIVAKYENNYNKEDFFEVDYVMQSYL